jgi:hypothetical protein
MKMVAKKKRKQTNPIDNSEFIPIPRPLCAVRELDKNGTGLWPWFSWDSSDKAATSGSDVDENDYDVTGWALLQVLRSIRETSVESLRKALEFASENPNRFHFPGHRDDFVFFIERELIRRGELVTIRRGPR